MHDLIKAPSLRVGQEVCVWAVSGITGRPAKVTEVEHHTNHLGGQWATFTIKITDGGPGAHAFHRLDSRTCVISGPEYREDAWCPECRATREVEERSEESNYVGDREVGYTVTRMVCGHTTEAGEHTVGASPGAPWAGDDVAVARSTRPRDLRDARARQEALDHPYGREHDQ